MRYWPGITAVSKETRHAGFQLRFFNHSRLIFLVLFAFSSIAYANIPPTANPAANPTSGAAPLTVDFTANASDPDSGPMPLEYFWEFEIGQLSAEANPTYTFTSPGIYVV